MSDQPLTNYTPAQADQVVRGMTVVHAKIAALEAENAELRAQVGRLDWQPITPENLPKVGDEVLYVDGSTASVDSSDCAVAGEWGLQYWKRVVCFRPINPPARTAPAKEPAQPKEGK